MLYVWFFFLYGIANGVDQIGTILTLVTELTVNLTLFYIFTKPLYLMYQTSIKSKTSQNNTRHLLNMTYFWTS